MTATAEQTAGRTLVKTTTVGWFIDAADPDGKRVRKTDADTIISRDDYDALKALQNGAPGRPAFDDSNAAAEQTQATQDAASNAEATQARNAEHRADAAAEAPTVLTSGRLSVGPTIEIKCAWVDPENRTKKQQKLFEGPTAEITYEKVVKAADNVLAAMPTGEPRTIKVQDQFQVRFSVENQKRHRNELRRRKTARRRAEREAAKS